MRLIATGLVFGLLAACGVDGPPTQPEKKSTPIGITITGKAEIGITGGSKR